MTLHHLVIGQVATRRIKYLLLLGLDAIQNSNGMIRRTIVVTPHHRFIMSVGTDDGDFLCILLQRQNVIFVL